jgi:hypothetical protein
LTTNAACRESISPARQMAQVAKPAKKARANEATSDFHENVLKALRNIER